MKRISKKHLTSAILLAMFIALLLTQLARADPITVSITPVAGPVGTTVAVSGLADTSGGTVNIYFDIDGDGETELQELQTSTTAATTAPYIYGTTITVPPSAAGTHAITATDVTAQTSSGTDFTVTPQISISPDFGPIGTVVTVTGTGFDGSSAITIMFKDIDVTPDPAPVTNEVGSLTASFEAPPAPAGDHTVTVTDAAGNSASDVFTLLGITVSIDPTAGPVGTLVSVSGTQATPGGLVAIWWDDVEVDTVTAEGDGTYSYDLTVPPSVAGAHTVTAEDVASTNIASETFTLLGITVSISPTSGPVGTIVTVTGTYATPEGSVAIRWDGIDIETITAELDGTYSYDLTVPPSVTGEHTVTVEDVLATNTDAKTFTVEPQIILIPEDGLVGDSVTVTGTGFSGNSQVDVYFDIDKDGIPDAEELMLDDVPTDEFGSFSPSFTVPWVSTAGNYLVRAVDTEDVTDDATFTVLFVMYTRNGEYFQGDYPSFFIQAVNTEGAPFGEVTVEVKIRDPNGYLQYRGITWTVGDGTVPYDMQFFNWWMFYLWDSGELTPMHLPSDATVGTWTWTAFADGLTVNGSFEVVEPVDLRTLLDMLDQLLEGQDDIADLIAYYGDKLQLEHDELAELIAAASNDLQLDHEELVNLINEVGDNLELGHTELADLVESVFDELEIKLDNISSDIVGIEDRVDGLYLVIGDLEVKLDDIDAKLVNIQDGLATVTTTLGEIETKIDSLGSVSIEEIKGDIATIKSDIGTIRVDVSNINGKIETLEGETATIQTDIGTVEASLSDIGAKINVANNNVATIETDIGTIKGRLTSVENGVATIQTDVGTVKTMASNIETTGESIKSDTSLQFPTVALALIAAIGAIVAVAMILRKVYVK